MPTIDEIHRHISEQNHLRVDFVADFIKNHTEPFSFADVGAGTGLLFTLPLYDRISDMENLASFRAYDVDQNSVDFGQQVCEENYPSDNRIRFDRINVSNSSGPFVMEMEFVGKTFDFLSCIEVLEHTEAPEHLLGYLYNHLKPGGRLFLSIPNKYGPYEVDAFLWRHFFRRVHALAKRVLGAFLSRPGDDGASGDMGWFRETLNEENNRHVSFFALTDIKRLVKAEGFVAEEVTKVGFLGGPIFNIFGSRSKWLREMNRHLIPKIPVGMASGWILRLRRD